jgi:hypothetical protein
MEHWVYSDGCAGQFKGAIAMYFVARYPGLTGGCKMRWNFFGSSHGKGQYFLPSSPAFVLNVHVQ